MSLNLQNNINTNNIDSVIMSNTFAYQPLKLDLNDQQIASILKGQEIRLKPSQIGHGKTLLLHPSQIRLILKKIKKDKGVIKLHISPAELISTAQSGLSDSLSGEGFGDWLSGAWKWVKDNWQDTLKPIASTVADVVSAANPELMPLRVGLKSLTGVGLDTDCLGPPPALRPKLYRGAGLYL
jgi:hypothetical protein